MVVPKSSHDRIDAACRPMVGQRVGTSRMVLDAYGNRLTTLPLPGDGWRTQHDAIKWKLSADMLDMHVRSSTEVYGLLAPLIPQVGRNHLDGEPRRKRQGLVPDFMVYERSQGMELPCFIELKTLHFGSSTYPLNLQSRCEAPDARPDYMESIARRRDPLIPCTVTP